MERTIRQQAQKGYIALMAVLVIGAASLAISLAVLTVGTESQSSVLVTQQGAQARSLAMACAEEALEQIHDSAVYAGSNNLTLGAGNCSYTVTNTGGTARSIVATGTAGTAVRHLAATATVGSTITTSGWQEVSLAPATITHVQTTGSTNDVGATSISQAYASNVTLGNLLVVSVSWDSTTTPVSLTCTDTLGNTYTTVNIWNDTTQSQAIGICYALNIATGANTVTATFGASSPFRRIIVGEYSGVAGAGPLDVSAGVGGGVATTGTDAVSSGAATTGQNGELIYGAVQDTNSATTIAAGTNFTQRFSLNSKDFAVQDRVQATAGSAASTQTFGATHRYDAAMVTFRPLLQ